MNIYDNIYDSLGKRDYAAALVYIRALEKYDMKEAARLCVSMYIEQGDSQSAMAAWQKLNKILPGDFYTSFLHARILFMERRYVSAYRELLVIDVPLNKRKGYGEKIANLLGQCCRILGRTQEAAAAYKEAAVWADTPELQAMEYSNFLFNLHYSGRHSAEFLRQQAAKFGKFLEKSKPFHHHRGREKHFLRVGYISADFRRHVCLCFFYDLLTSYDRKKFAVYVYMLGPEDTISEKLRKQVTGWRNLRGLSPQESAKAIYEDEIDILVDLAGHTKGNGLPILVYKPAPIQVSGIGYFASTGLSSVDYFLGDVYLDGEDGQTGQREFTEELVVLPHSHFCYRPLQAVPLPVDTAFSRKGYVTFGSFNNFAKVTDEVLMVWGKILNRLPTAHLLLKAAVFDSEEAAIYIRQRMEKAGLPMARVECRGISEVYLPEYGDIDIALDTFPYPGGGTSCDALYMGRPLITLAGKRHGERFGYSLLMNLDLGELVAFSIEEYIERAVMLAENPELLTGLQTNLRHIMENSPLMDRQGYVRMVESVYADMWEKYEKGCRNYGGENHGKSE
ncbi:hypothetical protein SELR_24540 [Selenomonas ruminantium subsp. lactilytica TAM6421]|uniref:O-GlcNAc transferase C-terminal domain-containing protein n=1 Tax=Selenomonas ruminantium subsp. lactilytica (strain NBRC 103574 / TAM6421) TaxID=927704 RepID=I0GTS5_SELRL|nr:hypothetical protein [Selenomonas ruminantium]BAL84162.1 hypothetical protein SELR_24540 [Selenomonas ruminantium subsp. lactilytica TAM6421]